MNLLRADLDVPKRRHDDSAAAALYTISHPGKSHMNIHSPHGFENSWVDVQLRTGLQRMTLHAFTYL